MGWFPGKNILEAIDERRDDKKELKLAKVELKQDGKTSRVIERQDTKKTAYANGIDPHSYIASLGESGAQLGASVFGKGSNPSNAAFGGQNMGIIAIGAVGLLLIFGLKK